MANSQNKTTNNLLLCETLINNFPNIRYKVRMILTYEGTNYCGWQSQKIHKNKNSIQNLIQTALTKIFKETITCQGASRTDAGVHALEQNIHFTTTKDPKSLPLILALNRLLPPTIVARAAWLTPMAFSCNKNAKAKTYKYYIFNSTTPSALNAYKTYWYPHKLNLVLLNQYSELLMGTHDFKTFQSSSGNPVKSTRRKIFKCRWTRITNSIYVFEIVGNGFLTQMVRNIVGTQLRYQFENKSAIEFNNLLKSKNRKLVGKPAPPHGLILAKVFYSKKTIENQIPIQGKIF